jgi:hypothetical protein
MVEQPTAAFILSLLGGIFVLLPGLALSALGTYLAFFTLGAGLILWIFPIFGIIIILGAVMMYVTPSSTKMWGIVVLILGVFSLVGVITGLGGLLALIGGILAIIWKPTS